MIRRTFGLVVQGVRMSKSWSQGRDCSRGAWADCFSRGSYRCMSWVHGDNFSLMGVTDVII